MKEKLFTRQEAEAKTGNNITTGVDFVGIPKGTAGTVIRAESTLDGNFVVVQWSVLRSRKLQPRKWPYQDWFSKIQYEQFLIEK